jgi:hypothetical protein
VHGKPLISLSQAGCCVVSDCDVLSRDLKWPLDASTDRRSNALDSSYGDDRPSLA